MSRSISREDDGAFRVALPAEERELLGRLPEQLRAALAEDEPSVYRLFPPAYADDVASNVEYHRLVGEGLLDGKLGALLELQRTAHAERLTEAELESWLGALESLRLVLGTQLDIVEESSGAFDPTDPEAPRIALYHWLSWLQEEVVHALAEALPPGSEEDDG